MWSFSAGFKLFFFFFLNAQSIWAVKSVTWLSFFQVIVVRGICLDCGWCMRTTCRGYRSTILCLLPPSPPSLPSLCFPQYFVYQSPVNWWFVHYFVVLQATLSICELKIRTFKKPWFSWLMPKFVVCVTQTPENVEKMGVLYIPSKIPKHGYPLFCQNDPWKWVRVSRLGVHDPVQTN